jgi:hypothetical protein
VYGYGVDHKGTNCGLKNICNLLRVTLCSPVVPCGNSIVLFFHHEYGGNMFRNVYEISEHTRLHL